MYIKSIKLKNFRCFTDRQFELGDQITLIEGKNGSGKTSLLEALYYGCYLRSFRTNNSRELISHDNAHFFVQLDVVLDDSVLADQIQIGFSDLEGKLVKFNQKPIQSYKELLACYRVVSLTTDDMSLVQGSPEERRDFLNYSLLLEEPLLLNDLRNYKHILTQRNSLLTSALRFGSKSSFNEQLFIWTKKLWEASQIIQKKRIKYLNQLEKQVNELFFSFFDQELIISLTYQPKNQKIEQSFDDFWKNYQQELQEREFQLNRTLFGMHLDDFSIIFQNQKARFFASRGQQKLLVFLMKVAQFKLIEMVGKTGVFLLDDFLTDFDRQKMSQAYAVLSSLNTQIIMTSPLPGIFSQEFNAKNAFLIEL